MDSSSGDHADAGGRRRHGRGGGDADRLVPRLAPRLHRQAGQPEPQRPAVDRTPRRQPVLRRRTGERRPDGRRP